MKLTKTLLLTTLAIGGLLACASVRAQDSTNQPSATPSTNAPPHRMMGRGPSIDRLAQILNLTADQKAKVAPILEEQHQKTHKVFLDNTLSRDEKIAQMKEIHDATAAQLKPILTDEQFQKWEKMSQPRQHRPTTPPPGAGNGASSSAP